MAYVVARSFGECCLNATAPEESCDAGQRAPGWSATCCGGSGYIRGSVCSAAANTIGATAGRNPKGLSLSLIDHPVRTYHSGDGIVTLSVRMAGTTVFAGTSRSPGCCCNASNRAGRGALQRGWRWAAAQEQRAPTICHRTAQRVRAYLKVRPG